MSRCCPKPSRIRLPKTNAAWSIDTSCCGRTEITASVIVTGRELANRVSIEDYVLQSAEQGYLDHLIEDSLRGLERAVGRHIVRGAP